MKKRCVLMLLTLLSVSVKSQSQYCMTTANSQNSSTSSQQSGIVCPITVMDYYPAGNDTAIIPLNFIFPKPSSGMGKFDTITAASCRAMVSFFNNKFGNINTPWLQLNPAVPHISDTKIRFTFKSISHPINDSIYHGPPVIQNTVPQFYWDVLNTDSTAINLIWESSSWDIKGVARKGSNEVFLIHDTTSTLNANFVSDSIRTVVLHEIGHCLGLPHTNEYAPSPNPNGNAPLAILAALEFPCDDYWFEDGNVWGQRRLCVTGANNNHYSNNIMAYNLGCQTYLSPKQIAYMHYIMQKYMKSYAHYTFNYSPYACSTDTLQDLDINTGTVLWNTPKHPLGSVTIKPGGHLIISTCVYMKKGAKIIVEKGAKLSIINGVVQNQCGNLWKGIEVYGDFGHSQAFGTGSIANNMPTWQGMLYLDNAKLINAQVAVTLGKRNSNGIIDSLSGGGIVYSNNSHYLNNRIAVEFAKFFNWGYTDNKSYFRRDTFLVDGNYLDTILPTYAVTLNKTMNVDFIGCHFNDKYFQSSIGINSINSSINVLDFCSSFVGNTCNGTIIQNTFVGFSHAINNSAITMQNQSKIDHAVFYQNQVNSNNQLLSYGAIYMENDYASQVVNNTFYNRKHFGTNPPPDPTYGLYLSGCTGYVVENNHFEGLNGYLTTGIFVNNSGAEPNSIYNNTFQYHQQGIWAQNQNYDPSSGGGLIMNCNDFLYSAYNIGVQFGPHFVYPNYTGIATTQGQAMIPGTQGPFKNVRNTYGVNSCNTYAQNKFYINSMNIFYVSNHGSFTGSQFHPTPQTNASCSDAGKLIDVIGYNPPGSWKTTYCTPNYMPSFSNQALIVNASNHHLEIANAAKYLKDSVDMGNTPLLLSDIHNTNLNSFDKHDKVLNSVFLSDTALISYFVTETNFAYISDVFQKNAPVAPKVWQGILNLNLSTTQMSSLSALQFTGSLSKRGAIESNLAFATTELGLVNHEKIRRWLADSSGVVFDSIIALYSGTDMPNAKYKLVNIYISKGDYTSAQSLITTLRNENTANADFCDIQNHISHLMQSDSYANTMKANNTIRSFLIGQAESNNALTESYARALLYQVYNYRMDEVRLQPIIPSTEGRFAGTERNENAAGITEIRLMEGVKLFPNPASNQIYVTIEATFKNAYIQITDIAGKLITKQLCNTNCVIDIATLQNGLFLVHLYEQDKLISTKKIIVAK